MVPSSFGNGNRCASLLPGIGSISSYILLTGGHDGRVEALAGAALFGDVLGVIAAVWKIVVGSGSPTRLEPVIDPDDA